MKLIYILEEHQYLKDIKRLKKIIENRGHNINLADVLCAWESYSSSLCAQWIILPKDDFKCWIAIKDYLIEVEK